MTNAYGYANITTNATTTLKTGQGKLHRLTVNNPGTAWVATIFDSTSGAGTKIGTVALAAGSLLEYDVEFVNGLTITTAGTTPGDLTVAFGG